MILIGISSYDIPKALTCIHKKLSFDEWDDLGDLTMKPQHIIIRRLADLQNYMAALDLSYVI
jgi:hypothetical protein